MAMQPCVDCGELSDRNRCAEHRPRDGRRHRGEGHSNDDPVMRSMSERLRKAVRFCERCGSTVDLTADHVIPKTVRPDLVHEPLNLRVLCRTCNSTKGATCTDAEMSAVLAAIEARSQRRNRRAAVSTRRNADRRPALDVVPPWAVGAKHSPPTPVGKAMFLSHTGSQSEEPS